MTTEMQVMAIIQKMYDSLALLPGPTFHPVDVLQAGRGLCSERSLAFQFMMHTLGLPTRGVSIYVLPEARYNATNFSYDPLSYTALYHASAEVFYDGKWHFFNANFGEFYDCSIAELISDPTIRPLLFQAYTHHDLNEPFFFAQVKEVQMEMDSNKWRFGPYSLETVPYTPLTARTLYGNALPSFPFKLQKGKQGFARDERLLPFYHFYYYCNGPAHVLAAGDTIRQSIPISPTEGIDRLSNQINVKWHPAAGVSQLAFNLTVNGHSHEIYANAAPGTASFVPIILDAPAADLVEGPNTIDIQLASPGTLELPYAGDREDIGLIFPVARKALTANPTVFDPLTRHLFWNIDLVYKIDCRASPGSIDIDLSAMPQVQKSIILLPPFPPVQRLGTDTPPAFLPLPNTAFLDNNLVLRRVPSFVMVKP